MKFYISETADMGYSPYDIMLDDTHELNEMADKIQKRKGELPLFDEAAYDRGEDNWYNFFLECDENGVTGLWFEYGYGAEYGDRIELSDQDKADAFTAVLNFYGGIEGYKAYMDSYNGEGDFDMEKYQQGWETILKTMINQ